MEGHPVFRTGSQCSADGVNTDVVLEPRGGENQAWGAGEGFAPLERQPFASLCSRRETAGSAHRS